MKDTKRKHLNNIKNLREENTQLKIDKEVMRRQLISVRNTINEILGDNKHVDLIGGEFNEKEAIRRYVENYLKGLKNLKEIEEIHHGQEKKTAEAVASDIKEAIDEKCGGCFETFAKESLKKLKRKYYCNSCYEYAVNEAKEKQQEITQNQQETAESQPTPSKCHNCQALGIYKRGFCFKCENEGMTKGTIKDVKATPEKSTFKCSKCGADGDDEGSFKTRNGKMFCIDCLGDAVGWKADNKK